MSTNQQRPWSPAFTVDGEQNAPIRLEQVSATKFRFSGLLRYEAEDQGLDGLPISDEKKQQARALAGATLGETDLATIPRFMRWFEGPYGAHTPAALIHDHLIVGGRPNEGILGSDTASDRYFRFMLGEVGVPVFKKWLMWAAVALRTRWVVGGWRDYRRWTLIAWGILSAAGIAAFVWSLLSLLGVVGDPLGVPALLVFALSLIAIVPASFLWGRQWGAGVVAALAAPWVLPAAVFAVLGWVVYRVLEAIAAHLGD